MKLHLLKRAEAAAWQLESKKLWAVAAVSLLAQLAVKLVVQTGSLEHRLGSGRG